MKNKTNVEGIEEARTMVETFLCRVKDSQKNGGQIEIILSQASARKDHVADDLIDSFDLNMQTDLGMLASKIVASAADDIETLSAPMLKYHVKADGTRLRCIFMLRRDDEEEMYDSAMKNLKRKLKVFKKLKKLLRTIDKDQFASLLSAQVLRPEQIVLLLKVIRVVMKTDKSIARADGATQTTPQPPRGTNQP